MENKGYNYSLKELESIIGKVFVVGPHNGMPAVSKPNGMMFEKEDIRKLIDTLYYHLDNMDEESIEEHNDELHDALTNGYPFGGEGRSIVDKSGFIYLLEAETGETKIGRTKKLDERVYHFTTKLPMDLKVIYYVEVEDSYALEKQLHSQYADNRTRGEWFNLTIEDVEDITAKHGMLVYQ